MFTVLLVVVLVAAAIHVARMSDRSVGRIGRVVLLYMLIGYCGVPMVMVSGATLIAPNRVAAVLGFPAGNPFQEFLGYAYLGMSLLSMLAVRFRGEFLVAPALVWAVFFAGATRIHLRDLAGRGALTHGGLLEMLLTHTLISILLVGALWASGVWRRGGADKRGDILHGAEIRAGHSGG